MIDYGYITVATASCHFDKALYAVGVGSNSGANIEQCGTIGNKRDITTGARRACRTHIKIAVHPRDCLSRHCLTRNQPASTPGCACELRPLLLPPPAGLTVTNKLPPVSTSMLPGI